MARHIVSTKTLTNCNLIVLRICRVDPTERHDVTLLVVDGIAADLNSFVPERQRQWPSDYAVCHSSYAFNSQHGMVPGSDRKEAP